MKTAGIIAEFNPFHKGHSHLLEKVRQEGGAEQICVIMSGDFVQRGAPAATDKYTRTRMALLGGADLVLELPCAAATGSAQRFAESAVFLLSSLGIADELWFGSEEGDLPAFCRAAEILSEEPPLYRELLRAFLKEGSPFPKARALALKSFQEQTGNAAVSDSFLSGPNNILGLEYMLALKKCGSGIEPRTIRRTGAGYHDASPASSGEESPVFFSAESVRESVFSGRGLPPGSLPDFTRNELLHAAEEGSLLRADDFSDMLLYQLSKETAGSLTSYADVDADLAARILRCRCMFTGFTDFADLLKTRNRTRTQIDRALLHILLNIRRKDLASALHPDFVRVLGFSKRAASGEIPLLRMLRDSASLRVVTRASELAGLDYGTDLFASMLYEQKKSRKAGMQKAVHEYERPLVIL